MHEQSDDALRARFRQLAAVETATAPAYEAVRRARTRTDRAVAPAWSALGGALAVAALVAITTLVWPRSVPPELEPLGTRWIAATDFLLATPGTEFLSDVPRVGLRAAPQLDPATAMRGDSSRSSQ
jgi:hypothetical protein